MTSAAWLPGGILSAVGFGHLRRGLSELAAIGGVVRLATLACYLVALGRSLAGVLRTSSLAPADFCMTGKSIRLEFAGHQYNLTGVPFSLVRELYCRQVYFPDRSWHPKAGDLVLDLGANIGAFTLLCAKRGCRVIAIEMHGGFEGQMRSLLQRNGCAAMVRAIQGAIAPEPALEKLIAGPRANSIGILHGADLHALAEGQVIALAKIDVEGSEFRLIEGDVGWLESVRRLAIEVHPEFGDPVTLRDRLRLIGFEAWLADKGGRRVERIIEPVGFCYAVR